MTFEPYSFQNYCALFCQLLIGVHVLQYIIIIRFTYLTSFTFKQLFFYTF